MCAHAATCWRVRAARRAGASTLRADQPRPTRGMLRRRIHCARAAAALSRWATLASLRQTRRRLRRRRLARPQRARTSRRARARHAPRRRARRSTCWRRCCGARQRPWTCSGTSCGTRWTRAPVRAARLARLSDAPCATAVMRSPEVEPSARGGCSWARRSACARRAAGRVAPVRLSSHAASAAAKRAMSRAGQHS